MTPCKFVCYLFVLKLFVHFNTYGHAILLRKIYWIFYITPLEANTEQRFH